MYDTIHTYLYRDNTSIENFLDHAKKNYNTNYTYIGKNATGENVNFRNQIGNLSITTSKDCIKIKKGSMCKFHNGENFSAFDQSSLADSLEILRNRLHLPIENSRVSRLDFAYNIVLDNPIELYLKYLGYHRNYRRLEQDNGLYYRLNIRELVLYDKIMEAKLRKKAIPPEFLNHNVLRYELRFKKNPAKQLDMNEITLYDLCRQKVYENIKNRWKDEYNQIPKLIAKVNFQPTRSIIELKNMLAYMQIVDQIGFSNMYKHIDEWFHRGILDRKQKFEFRKFLSNLYIPFEDKGKNIFTDELNQKILSI